MRNFIEIVGFEYKKMLMQKSAYIVVSLVLLFAVLNPIIRFMPGFSPADEISAWERMTIYRSYARELSGRTIDAALFEEAFRHGYLTPEGVWRFHILNWMPYISAEDFEYFYDIRHKQVSENINAFYVRNLISAQSVEHMLNADRQTPTPWVFEYTEGYSRFFNGMNALITVLAFAVAVCVAPIFAREHSTSVAQLILTSKHGKRKLVSAKILTAVSFTAILSLIFFAITYLMFMAVYGFDGAGAPFQLVSLFSPYPITIGQAALIIVFSSAVRIVFFGAFLLWLSSKLKSSFAVMIFAGVWIFLSMMFYLTVPIVWLFNLSRLFINALPNTRWVFYIVPYEIFGLTVFPFIFEPVFAVVMSIIFLPLAGRAFMRHQIQ